MEYRSKHRVLKDLKVGTQMNEKQRSIQHPQSLQKIQMNSIQASEVRTLLVSEEEAELLREMTNSGSRQDDPKMTPKHPVAPESKTCSKP